MLHTNKRKESGFLMDLLEIILSNKYRNQILEILVLCVRHQPVTRKLLDEEILLSIATINTIIYLLDSLKLVKIQYMGKTMLIRATEITESFLNESGV